MDPTAGIFAALADPRNAAVVAIAFALIFMVIRFTPPKISETVTFVRMIPAMPVLLCMAIVWIPGLSAAAALTAGDKLGLGAALGCGLAATHKIWMQTFLGRDKRIEEIRAARALPPEQAP